LPQGNAIPFFEIQPDFCTTSQKNFFYSHGLHTSRADWSPQQEEDFEVCGDILFLVRDFLSYLYRDFPKMRGYMGFKSGSICQSPSKYMEAFRTPSEQYKVDCEDQSGYFNSTCRPWFREQQARSNRAIMLDLYPDAVTKGLLTSICVDVKDPRNGSFYAAICEDVEIIQNFFKSHEFQYDSQSLGPGIFTKPAIL